jgi:exodeoxyribonuclease V alpha subunit
VSETIKGEVLRITYESEETGFRVVQLDVVGAGSITLVGRFQFVAVGSQVRVSGERVRDPRHGEQFRVHTVVPLAPDTLVGIERYLGSGLIPGVGPALANRIVTQFGLDTLDVLDKSPHRLREVPGLGKRRRTEIRSRWSELRVMADLNVLMATHGISASLSRRIFERYGDRTAEVVQNSPYRLAMEVRGIGFRTADRIARSLHIESDHPERVQAGVYQRLHDVADAGSVFAYHTALTESTAELLEIGPEHVPPAIDALFASGRVVVERNVEPAVADAPPADVVFLAPHHRAEVDLANRIFELMRFPAVRLLGVDHAIAAFEKAQSVSLEAEQRRAVATAALEKLVIITGGPGVGKTTIVRAVLDVFRQAKLTTLLAAPTGRAAKRLTEATSLPASTLHRLLEFDPVARGFKRNAERPLEAQAVIVDEASMIDLSLAQALFAALPERARLVIVGDADQLPSVAAGAVLRDLISSRVVPTIALTRVFRQAEQSQIVKSAHAILSGQAPSGASKADSGEDFFVIARNDETSAAQTVEKLVTQRIPERFGFDPRSEVQVLCPVHRGECGTVALNRRLQALLNPTGKVFERGNDVFRIGDRVMQLKNDYEKEVYNGDLGKIVRHDEESATVSIEFDGRLVHYSLSELEAVSLAYATTIHKSQGSEYPVVVIPLLMSHYVMLSRNLLYTAVTRARRLCVLVGDPRAIQVALSEVRREQRNTRLSARLRDLFAG